MCIRDRINIFSHIVEFRNGESGPHVLHIRTITEVLLNLSLIHIYHERVRRGAGVCRSDRR